MHFFYLLKNFVQVCKKKTKTLKRDCADPRAGKLDPVQSHIDKPAKHPRLR